MTSHSTHIHKSHIHVGLAEVSLRVGHETKVCSQMPGGQWVWHGIWTLRPRDLATEGLDASVGGSSCLGLMTGVVTPIWSDQVSWQWCMWGCEGWWVSGLAAGLNSHHRKAAAWVGHTVGEDQGYSMVNLHSLTIQCAAQHNGSKSVGTIQH